MNKIANILLDRLPQDYEGYLIRTDFGIGIQLSLCASDVEIGDYEKTVTMLNLLYGRGLPDFETAMNGLNWYLSGGKEAKNKNSKEHVQEKEREIMSFDFDDTRIYSAFRKVFSIDLQKERIHWFQFLSYLQDLSGTSYSDVINLRQTNESDVDAKKRGEFSRMKKRFELPNAYTQEEQESIYKALAQLNHSENNEP